MNYIKTFEAFTQSESEHFDEYLYESDFPWPTSSDDILDKGYEYFKKMGSTLTIYDGFQSGVNQKRWLGNPDNKTPKGNKILTPIEVMHLVFSLGQYESGSLHVTLLKAMKKHKNWKGLDAEQQKAAIEYLSNQMVSHGNMVYGGY